MSAEEAIRLWREARARISDPTFTGSALDVMREAEARLLDVPLAPKDDFREEVVKAAQRWREASGEHFDGDAYDAACELVEALAALEQQ